MGLAIETIAGYATNPNTAYTAVTVATGQSLTVRNFPTANKARLETIIRQGAASGAVRVRSPLLADDTQGIRFTTSETPSHMLLPPQVGEPLQPGDDLTVELTGGSAETDLAAIVNYYENLPGASSRLYNWSDISSNIEHIKPVLVAVTSNATAGEWEDTVITTTENLLKAGKDYACLGYVVDAAVGAVGLYGSETNNFRICGPGTTETNVTSAWFVDQANYHGVPHIPVFNANNKDNVYCSVVNDAASASVNVTLVLAQLTNTLS